MWDSKRSKPVTSFSLFISFTSIFYMISKKCVCGGGGGGGMVPDILLL